MPRILNRRTTNLTDGQHYTSKFNQEQLEENKKSNTKLDTLTTANHADLVSLHTQQEGIIGSINNTTLGDASLGQRTYVYAHDTVNGQAKALKCDAAGRLECSVDALEVSADTINLNTDTMEAKLLAISDGQTQNGNGTGNKPGVMLDAINSNTITGNGSLATIAGDTTSLNSKVALCNTGSVIISASALPSGASTSALQGTANTALAEIEGAVENLELAVGTNTATAPTRSLQIGGKVSDGSYRDIRVDSVGKVIVDADAGSTLSNALVAISNGQTQLGNGLGNKPGVMLDAINSNTITGNGKLDSVVGELQSILGDTNIIAEATTEINTGACVISSSVLPAGAATQTTLALAEAHLGNIETAVQLLDNAIVGTEMQCDIVASLPAGTNAIGKLSANSGVDIGDVDVTSLPLTFNSGNKDATCQRVVVATDDVNLSAIKTAVETIDNAIDGSEMQCDIVASLPAGTNAIGKLSANSGVDIGDVDVTSLPLTFNAGNADATCQRVVVATDDVNLSAIKTAVESLDNAVDGNYLNVNANIAGADVDANSGNKSGATQRVVIATDDVNLSAIKTAVETLDNAIDGSEMQCDIVASLPAGTNAIGKLSANSGVDIGDVDVTSLPLTFNSGNKDATCQRVVVATDDVNLSAIKTAVESLDNAVVTDDAAVTLGSQKGMAMMGFAGTQSVDANDAAMLACSTAGRLEVDVKNSVSTAVTNSALTALEACIGTDGDGTGPAKCISIAGTGALGDIQELRVDATGNLQVTATLSATDNAVIDVIADKNTLHTTSELKELLSGVTINSGAQSSQFDLENYDKARFFGETTASVGTDIVLMGAASDGGQPYILGENLRSDTISGVHYIYGPVIENLPRYVKILNKSGSTNYEFTKLYFQGSGGRVAV